MSCTAGSESVEIRDEIGRVSKGGNISCQPDRVAPTPSQRVQVAKECLSFNVLLYDCVQCCQCGFIPLANKTSRTHLKAVQCACKVSDICQLVYVQNDDDV